MELTNCTSAEMITLMVRLQAETNTLVVVSFYTEFPMDSLK